MTTACSALHSAFRLALMDVVHPGMDWEEAVRALLDARDRLAAPLALTSDTCIVDRADTREQHSLVSVLQTSFREAVSMLPDPAADPLNERCCPLPLQA